MSTKGCGLLAAGFFAAAALWAAPSLDFTLNATPAAALSLGGKWKIAKDPDNSGKAAGWFRSGPVTAAADADVPNPLELAFPGYDGVVWYWRTFDAGVLPKYDDVRIHFQGADYYAEAWLNGEYLGGNESALLPFAFDIKKVLRPGANQLVVRVVDACYKKEIDGFQLGHVPGGRQSDSPLDNGWRHENYGGLLLPVTVQAFRRPWISDGFIRPDIRGSKIDVDLTVVGGAPAEWTAAVRPAYPSAGKPEVRKTVRIEPDAQGHAIISVEIVNPHLWQIWEGFLYQLELVPKTGGTAWRDRFGMREIAIVGGRIAVNGKPILQRSFLYNQIWPVTLGVSYRDLARRDIELARRANGNMLRCFSKTPIPPTVEAADEIAILLQPESLASWYLQRGDKELARLKSLTERNVLLYRNHPSIVWWNVLNENAPKEDPNRANPTNDFTLGPYTLASILPSVHQLDPTRPVIANDPIWRDVPNLWEPGHAEPSLPLLQDHYYQFTGLENHEDSWAKIRERAWGEKPDADAKFLGITEWGQNSSPEWDRLIQSYKTSGVREDAEDYVTYRKLFDMNRRRYEEAKIQDLGFPTFDSVQQANRQSVAQRYREHFALFWGNVHSVGHGMTSLEDSSYEFSGVVDNWRNPKPVVFDTLTELNRPLQINLWLRPSAVYAGDKVTFDATLVNEGQRLAPGDYALVMKFVGEGNQVAVRKDYRHQIATGEPIEYLLTESLAADFAPGIYKLRLELSGKGATLTAERPVEVFARKPVKLGMVPPVWVWEKGTVLQEWLRQRGVEAKQGSAAQVRPGDLVLVSELPVEGDSIADIQAAVRRGARGIILRPEIVLDGGEKPKADAPFDRTYSELLEPVSGNWKPKLVEISWWGNPGAWGYSRTALALMSPYLKGLPQAVALEAQPAYQRVAPKYTWRLDGRPESVPVGRAVVESSLNVDTAYTSDLFSMPFGEGVLVLSTLHLAEYLSADPAADRILENIVEYRK